jgi:acyl-CoA dehydrogenase
MAIMDVAILLAATVMLAYFCASVWLWTIVFGITLIVVSCYGSLGYLSLFLIWLVYIAAVLFANLHTLRLRYFTHPLIKRLQKAMPTISETEREAIESGDVWWEKELFCGRPNWKTLLAIPSPQLSSEEQAFLDNQVQTLCDMLDDWKIFNNDHNLTKETWDYLKHERFFGIVLPKEYGWLGFSALAHSTIVTKIATRSISAAINTMVPNSLGPGELLTHYGTAEQKNYYLPRLAKGEEIPCFALTGPEAGSDAGAITDTGYVCRGIHQGKEVLGIRLNWDKRYITLAPIATVLGLAFRLYDPEHLLGSIVDVGITLCLIPTKHPGVEIGNRHYPLHLAFMNGPTRGKDVFIPVEWIIGGVEKAGQGWRMLMECLSMGRGISLPALSTACGKLTYRMTGAYARIRKQFNTSIANFEGVEEALANIAGITYTLEACRMMTAGAVDLHIRPAIASAIAKYQMTEMGRQVVNLAMDVHGGHGVQTGPRNFLANIYAALPIGITVEGANILTRNLIIFGQGAIRCHPYVLREVELLAAKTENNDKELNKILLSHMGYVFSNIIRNLWLGLTGGYLQYVPIQGPTASLYKQLTRMSSALALLADVSMMILGGNLKRRERISARLGDMLSELYLASAVLKYFNDNGRPNSDIPYVKWCVYMSLYHIQITCDELFSNFPPKWLGKILRLCIFPWGTAYRKPKDDLAHQLVSSMLTPCELRDRLTRYCFIGHDKDDATKRIEHAFMLRAELDPILKKFNLAVRSGQISQFQYDQDKWHSAIRAGILTEEEARALREFDALEKEVIKVNEFSFDLNSIVN